MKNQSLSRSKSWKIILLSVIFFQVVFLFVLVRYYSTIIIVPGQNISYEYWDWWLSQPKPYYGIIDTVNGIANIFQMLFLGEILFLLWKNRRKPHILISAVGLLLLGSGLLLGWRYYCIPNLLHYRIFMKFIPSEILALIVLLALMVDLYQPKTISSFTDEDK